MTTGILNSTEQLKQLTRDNSRLARRVKKYRNIAMVLAIPYVLITAPVSVPIIVYYAWRIAQKKRSEQLNKDQRQQLHKMQKQLYKVQEQLRKVEEQQQNLHKVQQQQLHKVDGQEKNLHKAEQKQQQLNKVQQQQMHKVRRQQMRDAYKARDYKTAGTLLRTICKSPLSDRTDYQRRMTVLHHLGRSDLVARYARFMANLGARGLAKPYDVALRLWACGNYAPALQQLGPPDDWQGDEQTAHLAFSCQSALRQYADASRFLDLKWKAPLNGPMVDRARKVAQFMERTNIDAPSNADVTPAIVAHWLACQKNGERLTYPSVARRAMIYVHSLAIGGAERQAKNLIECLCRDEAVSSVHLLMKNPDTEHRYDVKAPAGKFMLHDFGSIPDEIPSPWRGQAILEDVWSLSEALGLSSLPKVLTAIHEVRPEVVHVRGGLHAEVVLAAILANVPRIVVHFGSMSRGQQSHGTDAAILREKMVENIIAQCAAFPQLVVVANSRAAADDWAAECGLSKDRIGVIYNAIDADDIGFSGPVAPKSIKTGAPHVVGGVFRLASVKDPLLWVKVAARINAAIPGTRFLLVGDGPMRPAVEQAIAAAGLESQFEMPGFVTKDLIDYLTQMDIFLLTTRTESLPNAVIEAQLAGLPVIAPDVGGLREAVADESTAMLIERDADALARAVVQGLQNDRWLADVRARAPELIARRFSRETLLESTKSAYGWTS